MEGFGDKASFMAINGAISFVFEMEHPFSANYVHVYSGRDQSPSVVAE
jgi:hypothetical protein